HRRLPRRTRDEPYVGSTPTISAKKTDAAEHPQVFSRIGLLFNEPSSRRQIALYLVIRKLIHCRARIQFRIAAARPTSSIVRHAHGRNKGAACSFGILPTTGANGRLFVALLSPTAARR